MSEHDGVGPRQRESRTIAIRGGGLAHVGVHVGRPLEVTSDEWRELRAYADQMHRVAFHGKPGWLQEYVLAHTAAAKVIRKLIDRSQT